MKIVLCSSLNHLSYSDPTLVSLDKLKYLGLTYIFVTGYSKFLITIHKIKEFFLLFIYIFNFGGAVAPLILVELEREILYRFSWFEIEVNKLTFRTFRLK